jgi:predicted N-formylglutamate amidohydrolase
MRSGGESGADAMREPEAGAGAVALLGRDAPPAVEILNAQGGGRVVLLCDHASNRIPRRLGTLGLKPALLSDHIAWDPGAAEVARHLSAHLDAPLVLSGYSRLVIDCNRPLSSPQSIAESSAGVPIPGNHGLSPAERRARVEALFQPYHDAVCRLLDGRPQRATVLLSIHSFTPVLNGQPRPWHIGVSHWRDPRLATLLLGALSRSGDIVIGDNQPYPIEEDTDYTIPRHGEGRGLPSAMIEIRQDGLRSEADTAAWAARLADAYRSIAGELMQRLQSRAGD